MYMNIEAVLKLHLDEDVPHYEHLQSLQADTDFIHEMLKMKSKHMIETSRLKFDYFGRYTLSNKATQNQLQEWVLTSFPGILTFRRTWIEIP